MNAPGFSVVLDFWFGAPDSPERGRPRKAWFRKSEIFDAEIHRRFFATWEWAARGELERWRETPLASLALVVVLGQFPRNMFRGTARAFSSDSPALAAARGMIAREFRPAAVARRARLRLPAFRARGRSRRATPLPRPVPGAGPGAYRLRKA